MCHVLHYCTHLVRPLHRYGEASLCRAGQRPPINVWIGREGHTSNTTCRTDEAAQEPEMGVTHGLVSSCLIMVCSSHETKLCGMLITYVDHV